ncbi:MADS-box domain-containing protein [Heracleum sosnowskyi]|uniref:MADS-box domain-containing protein n=1 Tax=Heracleum sosnowskyi TaxID=360622 RepID=A0AAD8HU74_9APIA|nr:MADS-box domain-containing protein [Heracleum sosnowskyi]
MHLDENYATSNIMWHQCIDFWPENPTVVKALIKQFKDLTSNPNRRTTVKDESQKKFIGVSCQRTAIPDEYTSKVLAEPDGELLVRKDQCEENAEIVDLTMMVEKSSLSSRPSLTGYQEFLKQLDSRLEALTKRIEFLRKDQQYDTNCCRVENRQFEYSEQNKHLHYSEETSPKRRKISQATMFEFDLNYPPPDEPECSSLNSVDCFRNCPE